jgi:endo-1,3-1,4-beta-glycanase ExoK
MKFPTLASLGVLAATLYPRPALAVTSAELYTGTGYQYGRFEARLRFAAGDGVVSSFFLWKDGSEIAGTFWNELDFEKLGADCHLETNAFFGKPAAVHAQKYTQFTDLCSAFHTYTYEWTPEYIAWFVDGTELRREVGDTAKAYADNATAGMQIRFNVWPGDASFGGNFSPTILPVYQNIDWVQYSSYANGAFTVEWRDDFEAGPLASRWLTGSWPSPKNLSTHDARNVTIADGNAVLALANDGGGSGVGVPQGGGGAGGAGGSALVPAAGPSTGSDGCSMAPGRRSTNAPALFAVVGLLLLGRRSRRSR